MGSLQFVEALAISKDGGHGQHVFKIGFDLQRSGFDGENFSHGSRRPPARRLARRADDLRAAADLSEVSGTEFAVFAQDRWRVNERAEPRAGLPVRPGRRRRAGELFAAGRRGREPARRGTRHSARRVRKVRRADAADRGRVHPVRPADRSVGSPPTARRWAVRSRTRTSSTARCAHPKARCRRSPGISGSAAGCSSRPRTFTATGRSSYMVDPDAARGALALSSTGASKYWELETTGRFLASEYRDVSVSYVRSHSTGDLNDYDQFFGNFRNPIIRPNEQSLSPTDVPHRLIVRGAIGLPGKWVISPLFEWRTGFPWSAVDEFQDFVGPRNRVGPAAERLDARLHPRAAVALPQVPVHRRHQGLQRLRHRQRTRRAEQHDVTRLRQFYNPIQRSIGFVFTTTKP